MFRYLFTHLIVTNVLDKLLISGFQQKFQDVKNKKGGTF
jgi:hypothetical protein